MIRFAHPEYLYLLALLPVMVAAFWLFSRMRIAACKRFGTPTIVSAAGGDGQAASGG